MNWMPCDKDCVVYDTPFGGPIPRPTASSEFCVALTNKSLIRWQNRMATGINVLFYIDYAKRAGRNINDAIEKKLANLENYPSQLVSVLEWGGTLEIGERELLLPEEFTPSGANSLTTPIGLPPGFAWIDGQRDTCGQAIANLLIGMGVSPIQIQVQQGQIYTDGRTSNITFRVANS